MSDRYMKLLLTVIAINLTAIVTLQTMEMLVPDARAGSDDIVKVHVVGGTLDYATDQEPFFEGDFFRPRPTLLSAVVNP